MPRNQARIKMIKARSDLVLDLPFFANLALRLELREDSSCRTAWSDGRVLAYNPTYIDLLPHEKVMGIQCHEVLHLACLHHTRRNGRDKKLWNKACDYAINPILLEAGLTLPDGYLDDPALHGKSVDAIYKILIDRDAEPNGGADSGPETETSQEHGPNAKTGDSQNAGQDEHDGAPAPEQQAPDAAQASGAGGAGDVDEDSGDDTDNDPGLSGEVRDAAEPGEGEPDGNSNTGLRKEEENWQIALSQALQQSQQAGDVPGCIQRLCNELLTPTLPWSELLRRFLSDAARNDFSWVQPNRRYLHAGLYLPGLHNEELGQVAVAVDTSGSVDQSDLDAFAAELSAILEEFDSILHVYTCDTAVTGKYGLTNADLPLAFEATGGGGTDFRPPFEMLEQEGIDPHCMIYFTDLQCNRYPDEPTYPVLWVAPRQTFISPPFGETIVLEEQS